MIDLIITFLLALFLAALIVFLVLGSVFIAEDLKSQKARKAKNDRLGD